jgi:glycosyltransferase involved in cell wall biosynthesis
MKLSVVVPAYNEAEGIRYFLKELKFVLDEIPYNYEVIIVNDGSTDETSEEIMKFGWKQIREVQLINNSGHMAALEAGLRSSTGDFVVTMDADSQHPAQLIPKMIELQTKAGVDVVNGVRIRGTENSYFKRKVSSLFYRMLSRITNIKIQRDAGDFRLMSREVVDTLVSLPETTKVFRFLIPALGYEYRNVFFKSPVRSHGQSKYKVSHLTQLAISSIIGFSTAPLSAIFFSGLIIFLGATIYIFYLVVTMNVGKQVPGWTSVMVALVGLSAIQTISIGIVGRYIGQILTELRKRPRFIIRDIRDKEI